MSELMNYLNEIEELKEKYQLTAGEILTLQVLAACECNKVNYAEFKQKIKEKKENEYTYMYTYMAR